jgi:hypothetical protein
MADDLNSLLQAQHASTVLSGIMNPAQVNPLAALNSATQTAGGIYDLRQKQAVEAAGQAFQASIDPETGMPRQSVLMQNLAKDPRAAMAAQSSAQAGQTLDVAAYNQHSARLGRGADALGNLIGSYPGGIPGDAFRTAIQQEVATGLLTPADAAQLTGLVTDDPKKNSLVATQLYTHNMNTQQQLEQMYGKPITQTGPGGVTIGGVQNPRTGAVTGPAAQPGLPQGLSAESTAAYQQWLKGARDYPDPANPTVTKHGTNETFLRDSGTPEQFIYPGGAPATPGTQPSPLGTGRPPATLLNPNKPTTTSAPVAVPSPAGTGISGPTPAQTATAKATEEQGRLGPPEFQARAAEDTQAQNQQAVLGNMLADTSQFTTGPLAGIVGKVRNMAGNLGLNINTEAQSAKESFNKLAAGLANAQGAGSDQRMAVNISANPHEELSPAGVDMILRQLQGNTDFIRARASLAAKYPDKANYPAFQESIKDLDPRVFQLSRMTGPQRTTYWNSLDDTVQKQLGAAIKRAKDMGVLGG